MLQPDVVEMLESGCSLAVGLVTAAGAPFAGRAWGLTVADDGEHVRLLVPSSDLTALGLSEAELIGRTIATTGCHVQTLRGIQIKGQIESVDQATATDDAQFASYCDAFFGWVTEVDKFPRSLLNRMAARSVTALTFTIEEVYDQTPGPNAGAALAGGKR